MVKTPCFQCRGHGFDPWSEKFHMPRCAAKKKKRKRNVPDSAESSSEDGYIFSAKELRKALSQVKMLSS